MFPRRKANDQVSVTFLLPHFCSSLFRYVSGDVLFFFSLIHVKDHMINVSKILWDMGQERTGPSKERSAGQRTFQSLRKVLRVGLLKFIKNFAHTHWRRSIWRPFWKWLQRLLCQQLLEALGAWSLFSFASRQHHKTSEGCYISLSIYQPSVIDRFTREATFILEMKTRLSRNLVMRKYNLKVGVFNCTKAVEDRRFWWRMQIA